MKNKESIGILVVMVIAYILLMFAILAGLYAVIDKIDKKNTDTSLEHTVPNGSLTEQ